MKHVLALVVVLLAACGGGRAPSAGAASTGAAGPGMPFALERLVESFAGRAVEVLQVSGYTYLAVEIAPDDVRWVVSLQKQIDEGAPVRVRAFGKKSDFSSKKLGRTFAVLWFGIVNQGEEQ